MIFLAPVISYQLEPLAYIKQELASNTRTKRECKNIHDFHTLRLALTADTDKMN